MAQLRQTILPPFLKDKFNRSSQTETAHSADFTDFEEVIGSEDKNLFVAKLQGIDNRNLLYLCNLRSLWLTPLRFLGLIHTVLAILL